MFGCKVHLDSVLAGHSASMSTECAAVASAKGAAPPTYKLCWFVWPFVDERLEGLLHGVDKLVVLHEADIDDVVHLVLEVQQLLHHRLVLFRVDDDCASKCLQVGFKDNGKRHNDASSRMGFTDIFRNHRTLMYSIQCCRRTWTPLRTRLKSW